MVETDLRTKQDVSNSESRNLTPERSPDEHPWFKPAGPTEKIRLHYVVQQCLSSCPRLMADLLVVALVHCIAIFLGWPETVMRELSFFTFALIFMFWASSQYPGIATHTSVVIRRIFVLTSLMAIGMLALSFSRESGGSTIYRIQLLGIWLTVSVMVPVCRGLLAAIFNRFDWCTQPIVVIGSDSLALSVYTELKKSKQIGLRPIGLIVNASDQWEECSISQSDVIGTTNEVAQIQKKYGAYWAFSATQDNSRDPLEIEFNEIAKTHFPNRLTLADQARPRASVWDETFCVGKLMMVRQTDRLMLPLQRLLKRVFDLAISISLILLLLPVFVILFLLVRLTSKGPAIFKSRRVGRGNSEFLMTKFRTMHKDGAKILEDYFDNHNDQEIKFERDHKLENDPRVTSMGVFLRRSSLDELPQLFDVLTGKMSMVGPRPMLLNEQRLYGNVLNDYSRVLPGITGMWQVSGRNQTSYEDRLHYVEFYIRNWSIWLDFYILAKTAWVVLRKEGAY